MFKKTYWWRILNFSFGVAAFCFGWLFDGLHSGLCQDKNGIEDCIIGYSPYAKATLLLSSVFLMIAFVLFFVKDSIFKEWLKVTAIWFVISAYILSQATAGDMGLGISKELVAIFAGLVLIIYSIFIIVYQNNKLINFKK